MTREYEQLTIEQVAHFPRPGMVIPAGLGFTPDSTAVTYLYSEEGSLARGLWRYELATGERTLIAGPPPKRAFSREEELRRERMRMREEGVTGYAFAAEASDEVLLVPAADALRVSINGGTFMDLHDTAGVIDPHLSPDGTKVAFVREGELWVQTVTSGEARRLTFDAVDGLTNGLAEFIAQEELDRLRGFWWNPDSSRIAFLQADSRHIPSYPIVHQGRADVDVEYHRYPFAGAPNAHVRAAIADVASGEITWLDLDSSEDFYVARVAWRPDSVLTAQVLSRDQKNLNLAVFEGGAANVIVHEHTSPWVNLHNDLKFLDDGTFLWSSEASGYRHLELRARDGSKVRDLTSGAWVVTAVIGVDEARRLVYFQGTRESPLERHLYRVSLDGGEPERLTFAESWNAGVLSRDGNTLLVVAMSEHTSPSVEVVSLESGERTPLMPAAPVTAESTGLTPPEYVSLNAADGTELFGAIYAPPDREPGRRYPVIVSVYGGPHAQQVAKHWGLTVDLSAQYLAQQGFVVFKLDNRGSGNRGLAFESDLHLNMGSVEVADQAAGVAWLAANCDFADTSRVGVYGWSYGGYMTLMCLAQRPDVFHVGVAGAPVTHWDGYDTGYTERYMSTPQENPDGYESSSVMAHLDGLAGNLLIVHGMVDENVHFRHTARLIVELARRGIPYEVLLYPEERHMPRDPKGLEDHERRVLSFLVDRLRR